MTANKLPPLRLAGRLFSLPGCHHLITYRYYDCHHRYDCMIASLRHWLCYELVGDGCAYTFIYFFFDFLDLQPRYKAQYLLDYVCQQLDVVEKDYFGLRYVNHRKQRKWFDFTKSVANQMRGNQTDAIRNAIIMPSCIIHIHSLVKCNQ